MKPFTADQSKAPVSQERNLRRANARIYHPPPHEFVALSSAFTAAAERSAPATKSARPASLWHLSSFARLKASAVSPSRRA